MSALRADMGTDKRAMFPGSAGLMPAALESFLLESPVAARRRVLLLILLPTLVWFPTLTFDFVLDDVGTFLEDPLAQGPLNLPAIFKSAVHVERSALPYYRPIVTLSYWIDRTLWGTNPAGFHLTNLLWHGLTVLFAYVLLRQAGAAVGMGLATAALFAVLPSHAEAVAWIQGRVDLVSSAFFLAAVNAAMRLRVQPTLWGWVAALLAFAIALLAKEPAVILPGVLVLIWRVRGHEPWRATAVRLAPFLVVLVSYLGIRHAVLSQTAGFPLALDQFAARVLGFLAVLLEYLRIVIWPGLLPNFHMTVAPNSLVTPARVAASLVVALGLLLAVIMRRRTDQGRGKSWVPAIGVTWFLITLLPVLGVVAAQKAPAMGFLVTERYVYLPSLGLCVAAAWGLAHLSLRQGWTVGLATLLFVVASSGSLVRTQAWRDPETTYRAILPRTADRALAHVNLGTLYLARGEIQEAITEFETVLREDPNHAIALNNLGVARVRQGRAEEALALYRQALQQRPSYAEAWNNIGVLMEDQGKWGEARAAYQKALALDPRLPQARRNLEGLGKAAPPSTSPSPLTGAGWDEG